MHPQKQNLYPLVYETVQRKWRVPRGFIGQYTTRQELFAQVWDGESFSRHPWDYAKKVKGSSRIYRTVYNKARAIHTTIRRSKESDNVFADLWDGIQHGKSYSRIYETVNPFPVIYGTVQTSSRIYRMVHSKARAIHGSMRRWIVFQSTMGWCKESGEVFADLWGGIQGGKSYL
jgi:hypothetical protein